ncbi:class I SAM-dependent methyltransferase [Campylobacter lari]|uniref:class I SAM-dependent methyltransferase n=1 Tax=Campylobacter lari TaxID=201 RepID=UPI0012848536|nr:class I SAM-dependent methyltransferase [Campylobacter lari]EAH5177819.1 class I SAM-dependent methyltransferase [Campylobacter lari]EAI4303161.1 class I SAM-dependent methyltransferase [Campylobacter lari]EAI4812711.1 class I SAM-dependent methyltransferase [Campylobacter lari]EAI4842088.1 class I SAM-dependent methyltransferase [Campylobacter lari]EAI9743911.1 class I SAM-dependent methyltransferase [Campylobacter lari]
MLENTKKLFKLIEEKNQLHKKCLDGLRFYKEEYEDLEKLIVYYKDTLNITLEEQAQSYIVVLNDTLEETRYFIEFGKYRYSTLAEVENMVYFNENYMKQYMVGLAISSFIWNAHIEVRRYFAKYIDEKQNQENIYLEIGPGHGEFFVKALRSQKFKEYFGIDISPISCQMSKDIVENQFGQINAKCEFICKDFTKCEFNNKADLVVMGEVLEHVEQPLEFMKNVKALLNDNGEIFATIPINAPAIDHIYLFSHPDEVKELLNKAGLKIKKREYFTANNYSLEKALKTKNAIIMTVILTMK